MGDGLTAIASSTPLPPTNSTLRRRFVTDGQATRTSLRSCSARSPRRPRLARNLHRHGPRRPRMTGIITEGRAAPVRPGRSDPLYYHVLAIVVYLQPRRSGAPLPAWPSSTSAGSTGPLHRALQMLIGTPSCLRLLPRSRPRDVMTQTRPSTWITRIAPSPVRHRLAPRAAATSRGRSASACPDTSRPQRSASHLKSAAGCSI